MVIINQIVQGVNRVSISNKSKDEDQDQDEN